MTRSDSRQYHGKGYTAKGATIGSHCLRIELRRYSRERRSKTVTECRLHYVKLLIRLFSGFCCFCLDRTNRTNRHNSKPRKYAAPFRLVSRAVIVKSIANRKRKRETRTKKSRGLVRLILYSVLLFPRDLYRVRVSPES